MKVISLIICGMLVILGAHAAPDPLGDADSFGRNVVYLGLASTPNIVFTTNCAGAPLPAPARCVNMNAQPALTPFVENKLTTLTIPAKSTHSLLCFAVTPAITFQFHNQTGVAQPTARFSARPTVIIENEVLNDPALIDPTTGLPFNGRISTSLMTFMQSRNMAANDRDMQQLFVSRTCIEGLISHRALQDVYGLPAQVVDEFFQHPTTLVLGASGDAQLVTNASYYYGLRVYGDSP